MKLFEEKYKLLDTNVCILRNKNSKFIPTIFLHGWMDNANSFLPMSQYLPEQNLFLVDLPGHGKSDHFNSNYDLAFYCRNIITLVKKIIADSEFDKVNLVGHSLRGVITSLVASTFPELLNKIIFLEAFGPLVDSAKNTSTRLKLHLDKSCSLNQGPRIYPTESDCIKARTVGGAMSFESASILGQRGISKAPNGYYWHHDRYLKIPSATRYTEDAVQDLLEKIEKKVFIIYATNPLDLAKPHIEKRLTYFQNLKTKILEGGHHFHMEDSAKTVAQEINLYLNS